MSDLVSIHRSTPHNLELYRLEGFSARRTQLLQLHEWMTGGEDRPAIAISGEQGVGKSTLATAAAWNHFHHFTDGIIRVGAAGSHRFHLYDVVRTMDTVLDTTLTRVSTERWGISILEQLYHRKRLLILDELSGATSEELNTLVSIIGHLHEASGQSRVLFIDRDFSPAIADLVRHQHLHLAGLIPQNVARFIRQRAPEGVRDRALLHEAELGAITQGQPLALRLVFGLMLDYEWPELVELLQNITDEHGVLRSHELVTFAVETFALIEPQAGPLLDQMVSATGGASLAALRDLFWAGLGTPEELDRTLQALLDRALLEVDRYNQRVVMHPMVRRYLEQNVVMLGEDWERKHARYYVSVAEEYPRLPVERWPEVDVEWGNINRALDWCTAHVQRLWDRDALEMLSDSGLDRSVLTLPTSDLQFAADMQLARRYALAIAHYAFWRHPLGAQRWFAAGAIASLALFDMRNYALLLMNIGRQHFFAGEVDEAIEWLSRAAEIFDRQDVLDDLAYAYTDLGTSYRILDQPRRSLRYFFAAFECVAQSGDQLGLATASMNLGSAYYSLTDYERAFFEHRKALRIGMRLNDDHLCASAFNNMGLALEGLGKIDEAMRAYERALDIFRTIDDVTGISTCYNNLGSASYAQKEYGQALDWYEKDLALAERRGAWTDMAATLHNLGHVAVEQGEHDRSRTYFAQSRDLYAAFQLTEYVREEQEMIDYLQSIAAKSGSRA